MKGEGSHEHEASQLTADSPGNAPSRGSEIGARIAGAFGLIFIVANSSGLPAAIRLILAIAGIVTLLAIIVLTNRGLQQRRRSRMQRGSAAPQGSPFNRKYWLIVAVEGLALFAGSLLVSWMGYPELNAAWAAFIVGLHFFALVPVFHIKQFNAVGSVVATLGIAGFVLRLCGQIDAIAIVSGVFSGFVLLAFSLWLARYASADDRHR